VSVGWPDVVIVGIALIAALKGFKRGFVAELGGTLALAAAVIAGFLYNGVLDQLIESIMHVGVGSSHVIGLIAFALLVYAVFMGASLLLGTIAKLPILGIGNSIGGAGVGIVKAAVGLWAVLYICLFFPLTPDLRADFHRSPLVVMLASPNEQLDGTIRGNMPWFAKPFAQPFFNRHRV
jgi:uncharacterized membrane protein required for colicin V production